MHKDEIQALTLGADPELILSKAGKFVPASECLYSEEQFGCDGNSSVAELRPEPAKTPLGVVEYIGALINDASQKIPDISMHAGAMAFGYPIGGHIHFGTYATPARIKNLDTVTEAFESLVYNRADIERRRASDYGIPGAYRNQTHGFEYRTPASWLISPTIALSMLTLAKLAIINDTIDLQEIKGSLPNKEWLLSLQNNADLLIPEDCLEGLQYLEEAITTKYNDDIIKNWIEDATT